jgi:prepilin signal peptidase PulO-like enzyme (type II secretory pathway)
LEQKKSLSGRSFCPHCKHALNWKDLIPVFSFIFLKGKCRYCKAKISVQYPIVELATGAIFLIIFKLLNAGFLFYIASVLIIIFVYDLKHYLIPDKVLLPAILITLIYRLTDIPHFFNYFLAALVASGFFFSLFFFSQGKWMGFGDVKLAILMGLFLGFKNVLAALFLAFFLGAIIGVIAMALQKKKLKSEIPFAPFLITGTFLALIFGEKMVNWYINFF